VYSYSYQFYLYAQHSVSISGRAGFAHPHTWSFIANFGAHKSFSKFTEIEEIINEVIEPYQNCYLNEKEPFVKLNPTMENIGEVFYRKIEDVLKAREITIKGLEISETPVRTYVVDQTALSAGSSEVSKKQLSGIIQGIISYAEDTLTEEVQILDRNALTTAPQSQRQEERIILEKPEEIAPFETAKVEEIVQQEEPFSLTTDEQEAFRKRPQWSQILFASLTILGSAVLIVWFVNLKGHYPWGSDTYGHIFKADLLYKAIKTGDFYPQYTELWYNGIQPFRYWAPIPYYVLAMFQFLTKGDSIAAYNVFIAFCFVAGAFGWLLWGIREKRIFLSTILGILWFCMPDNIRVFFSEGNLPRVIITVLLPYFFYFLWQFVEYEKKYALVAIILFTPLLCLSHLMITAMVGITVFLFMLYYGIANKTFLRPFQALVGMLLGISLCGFWLYPALQGGLMSMDSEAVSEVMKDLTFPFFQTLNPFLRFENVEIYYFGVSFLAISLIGLFLSNKKSFPGFLTLITVFLGTTTAFVPFLLKLPFNQLLWMMRFTPVAYAAFVIGLLLWKDLKRYAMVFMMLFLIFDSLISFQLLAHNANPVPDLKDLLDEAIKVTDQRVALLDSSEFGSFPSYYLTTGEKPVSYAYGWAWQGAQTAQNIVLLNTALEKEFYVFMFDRSLEAGCDTVIVKKDKVKDFDRLDAAAQISHYYLVKESSNGYIYHIKTPARFGVKTEYDGIAIGKSAPNIVIEFPAVEIGNSNYLDDYTLEDLLHYRVVYLSDFEYWDQKKAEQLVLDAAKQGVKFVIDMNRVPYQAVTNRMTFLGVTAQPIQFENQLPSLHFSGITYFPITFQEENRTWNTVYLENVPNPRGFSWFGGNKLVFIGEDTNPNITFIGFNLLYHGIVNKDSKVIDMFGTVLGMLKDAVPKREIVPIQVSIAKDQISIETQGGDIDTALANLDAFEADDGTYSKHNLLHVTKDEATIHIQSPYWKEGVAVSVVGLIASMLFMNKVLKSKGDKRDKNEKSNFGTASDHHSADRVLTESR
jgi:6-pyruvoyl tetrahydropterin synthase-like protein